MSTHRIELFEEGTFTGARIVCDGTDADLCRQWCVEGGGGCEEGCYGTPIPADTELIAQAPADGHRWAPIGSCRIAEWLNSAGIEDTYADEDGDWPPKLPEPRNGVIEEEWTGDDYVWGYAPDQPAGPPAAVPRVAGQLELLPAP